MTRLTYERMFMVFWSCDCCGKVGHFDRDAAEDCLTTRERLDEAHHAKAPDCKATPYVMERRYEYHLAE